jgi:hypothetical protein
MTLLVPPYSSSITNRGIWQRTEKGNAVPLETYKGKVLLIVNTASKCGFTPQYQGLENLYKKISETHPDQFVILGFPCNQFGGQEPVRFQPSLSMLVYGGAPQTPVLAALACPLIKDDQWFLLADTWVTGLR